jgi:hypothetical protein
LLFTQSALPLLEFRNVDLALCEPLLQDLERRGLNRECSEPSQRTRSTTTPTTMARNKDHHQKAEEHVEQTASPHHPRAPITLVRLAMVI